MQIKKGPFGYYACEKIDSPDKLCEYAEEVIAGNKSDFYLTPITEYIGSGIFCCFEFSGYTQVTDPEFSVFSSGKKITSHRKASRILSLRRRSLGDLFYSFVGFLNNLVSPACIIMDPDMVFTDPEGISIKLCCLPVKSLPEDLCLSSLGASRLEKLLSCDFFKSVITEDERNALVYSVKDNNESMFLKIAGLIKGTDENCFALNRTDPDIRISGKDQSAGQNGFPKTEKDLLIALISAVLSFVSLFMNMSLPCLLFIFLSLVILLTSLLNKKKLEKSEDLEKTQEKSIQRSSILFSGGSLPYQNEQQKKSVKRYKMNRNSLLAKPEEQDLYLKPLLTGSLKLLSDSKGISPQYAVYLDSTNIGSDCFLSDIVLDEPCVLPVHAVIRQKDGSFYLEPCEGCGKTYIEDSPVINGRSYEIKSGQKITIGDIEFRFCTENNIKMTY